MSNPNDPWPDDTSPILMYALEAAAWIVPILLILVSMFFITFAGEFDFATGRGDGGAGLDNWMPAWTILGLLGAFTLAFKFGAFD